MNKQPITKKLLITLVTPDGENVLYDGTGTIDEYIPELESWTHYQLRLSKILEEQFEKISYASLTDDYTVVVYIKK